MRFPLQFLDAHPHYRWNRHAVIEMFKIFAPKVNASGTVCLHLVSPSRIMELNRLYRGKNRPTDILSFRFDDENTFLGEIAMCPDVAFRRLGTSSGAQSDLHMTKLMVHSFCHLLGHDHHSHTEWIKMRASELSLLRALGRSRKILSC